MVGDPGSQPAKWNRERQDVGSAPHVGRGSEIAVTGGSAPLEPRSRGVAVRVDRAVERGVGGGHGGGGQGSDDR